jgi:hypothetical protein
MEYWKITNSKHHISEFSVSGFRFQVFGKDIYAETCWRGAEIPSEAE